MEMIFKLGERLSKDDLIILSGAIERYDFLEFYNEDRSGSDREVSLVFKNKEEKQ